MRSLRHRLLSIFVLTIFLVAVLTPDKVSAHSFESVSWFGSSLHAKSMTGMAGIFSQGIGGLKVNIDSDPDLSVSNLSYNNGHLHANIENKPVNFKVSPKIVQEAIRVMKHTDKQVFEVSLDSTAVGNIPYINEALKNTTIGQLLLDADLDFASVVDGSQLLPEKVNPYEKGSVLLDKHADYKKLPDKWINPPLSWSQIYLHFKPMMPGLVQLEFNPQIFFLSASGHPVEVSKKIEELGELPYEPLKEDVRNNPQVYIKAVPALEDAASITATLGLVAAGCQKPASCLNLKRQAWISSIMSYLSNELKKKTEDDANQSRIKEVQKAIKQVQEAQSEFMDKWVERSFHSLQNFYPGNNSDITWAKAYDAVQIGIKNLSKENLIDSILPYMRVSFTPEELKKATESISKTRTNDLSKRAKELAKQQFIDNSVPPNDPLLMTASAITFAWNGDIKLAREKLYRAIKQSTNNPGTYFQVAKMGRSVGQIIKKENKSMGEEIDLRMKFEQRKAKVKAYDEIDHCLKDYEKKKLLNCIPKGISRKDKQTKDLKTYELRMLETYARESGLYEYVPRRDLAWLHGRFAYLIGNEINEINDPTQKKDRLRFLSAYTQKAQPGWHRWKLRQLENKMRISLGMKPHPTDWRSLILGVAIGVAILDVVQQSLKKRRA